jgi:protein-disulfide isomerase
MAFRHLPLPNHRNAPRAAQAAECANDQGRFWHMHDIMFMNPQQLDEANLLRRAAELGMNATGFASCLSGSPKARIIADVAEARRLGITGTPAFLIGPVVRQGMVKVVEIIQGAVPAPQFRRVLEQILRP